MKRSLVVLIVILLFISVGIYIRSHKSSNPSTTVPEIAAPPVSEQIPKDKKIETKASDSLDGSVPNELEFNVKDPAAPKVSKSELIIERPPISQEEIDTLRSKAKVALTSFYAASRKYHAQYKRYTTDLKSLNWSPENPVMPIKMGFLTSYHPHEFDGYPNEEEDPKRMDMDFFENTLVPGFKDKYYKYSAHIKDVNLSRFEKFCKRGCTASDKNFEMIMAVPLGSSRHIDVWVINSRKEFKLVRDGYNNPLKATER